jgi:DnaJ homolog subfamily C member 28
MSDDFENPIDKIIRDARERGDFDNLPGKGKPLQWEDESQVPEQERMARRLLRNNNFTLDWIELSRELDAAYQGLREGLEQARRRKEAGELDAAGWFAVLDDFRDKVRELNRRVIHYNLRVPNEHFHKRAYPLE